MWRRCSSCFICRLTELCISFRLTVVLCKEISLLSKKFTSCLTTAGVSVLRFVILTDGSSLDQSFTAETDVNMGNTFIITDRCSPNYWICLEIMARSEFSSPFKCFFYGSGCIMGSVVSSVFRAYPTWGTNSDYIYNYFSHLWSSSNDTHLKSQHFYINKCLFPVNHFFHLPCRMFLFVPKQRMVSLITVAALLFMLI